MPETEKRKDPRRKVRIPIICWEMEGENKVGKGKEIVSRDLSSGGVSFYSGEMCSINTTLCIEIYLPSLVLFDNCSCSTAQRPAMNGKQYNVSPILEQCLWCRYNFLFDRCVLY